MFYSLITAGDCSVAKLCPIIATSLTVAHQAPLSMRFPRQEYWSGLPFPSPGDLPDPGIKPWSPALQEDSLPTKPTHKYTCHTDTSPTHTHEVL